MDADRDDGAVRQNAAADKRDAAAVDSPSGDDDEWKADREDRRCDWDRPGRPDRPARSRFPMTATCCFRPIAPPRPSTFLLLSSPIVPCSRTVVFLEIDRRRFPRGRNRAQIENRSSLIHRKLSRRTFVRVRKRATNAIVAVTLHHHVTPRRREEDEVGRREMRSLFRVALAGSRWCPRVAASRGGSRSRVRAPSRLAIY